MKLSFKKEDLKENFQKVIIVIGLFILVILSIKSGGSISQQNVSTVIIPEKTNIESKSNNIDNKNPYYVAYETCTVFSMSANDTQKCINYELGRRGIKN